ncbi:MAG: hypothetical protein E7183_07835 [Erysipelotrichaceae bacterium]|nr:hypothetical protein [Erysipelotrichaceae bacterium]
MKRKKIILFSLSALLICLIAVMSCVFINSNNKDLVNTNKNLVVQTENSNHIKLSRKKAVNEGNSEATESYAITANLEGNFNETPFLAWDLSWKTTSTLDVNDYISLEVSEDSYTCTVNFIQHFDIQIILTVSAPEYETINPATCTIDCNYKVTQLNSCQMFITESNSYLVDYQLNEYVINYENLSNDNILNDKLLELGVDYLHVGTVGDISYSVNLSLSQELLECFAQNDITPGFTSSVFEDFSNFSIIQILNCFLNNNPNSGLTQIQIECLMQCSNWYNLDVVFSNGQQFTIYAINMNKDNLFSNPSITLSEDSIVF